MVTFGILMIALGAMLILMIARSIIDFRKENNDRRF